MTFLEKLDFLMKRNGDNVSTLSKKSGIPYTTIDGFYKKGYGNTKLSTLQKLSDYFKVTLDYLVKDDITDPNHGISPGDDKRESELIAIFRSMNDNGKTMLLETARAYSGNPDMQQENSGRQVV